MTELKPCPKCKSYPSFNPYDNGEYEVTCGCYEEIEGHGSCCFGDEIKHFKGFNLLELIEKWNEYVDQQFKLSLPKTWEEVKASISESDKYISYEIYNHAIRIENGSKNPSFLKRIRLFCKLTLATEIYNDGWVWDGNRQYCHIVYSEESNELVAMYNEYPTAFIKLKSREIAEEFAKNFGDMIKEFYSL